MRLFAIDNDNTITTFPDAEQVPEGQEHFATEKELASSPPTGPPTAWSKSGTASPGSPDSARTSSRSRSSPTARAPWRGSGRPSRTSTGRPPFTPRHGDYFFFFFFFFRRRCPEGQEVEEGCHLQGRRAHGARGQQEGHRAGTDPPQGRRDAGRNRQSYPLAIATAFGASSAAA